MPKGPESAGCPRPPTALPPVALPASRLRPRKTSCRGPPCYSATSTVPWKRSGAPLTLDIALQRLFRHVETNGIHVKLAFLGDFRMETKGLSTGGAADPQWHHVARLVGFGAVDGSCRGPVGPQSDGPRVKELCRDGDHVPKTCFTPVWDQEHLFFLAKSRSQRGPRPDVGTRRGPLPAPYPRPSRRSSTPCPAPGWCKPAQRDALHVHAGGAEGRGDRQHRPGLRAAPPGPGWGPLAGGEAFLASSARTSGREGPAVGVVVGSGADAAP